jgi:hypothetical protein
MDCHLHLQHLFAIGFPILVGFPTWDTCGNNVHNNDKGIHIVCCVLLCSPVWRENQLIVFAYTGSKCCHPAMKSHMLLPLLKVHLLINPKDTQLLKFLSCFQIGQWYSTVEHGMVIDIC